MADPDVNGFFSGAAGFVILGLCPRNPRRLRRRDGFLEPAVLGCGHLPWALLTGSDSAVFLGVRLVFFTGGTKVGSGVALGDPTKVCDQQTLLPLSFWVRRARWRFACARLVGESGAREGEGEARPGREGVRVSG